MTSRLLATLDASAAVLGAAAPARADSVKLLTLVIKRSALRTPAHSAGRGQGAGAGRARRTAA